jgi:hypothetical protein
MATSTTASPSLRVNPNRIRENTYRDECFTSSASTRLGTVDEEHQPRSCSLDPRRGMVMEAFIHLNRVSERRNPSSMSESLIVLEGSLVNARVTVSEYV